MRVCARMVFGFGLGLGLAGIAACGPLPLELAYSEQREICADEELLAELVADCRARWLADGSCAGVLGFAGVLEGVDVVIESELEITEINQLQTLAGPLVRDGLAMTGRSPYFEYTLVLKHVGGPIDQPDAPARTLIVGGPQDVYDDDRVAAALRLATGVESVDLNAVEGEVVSTLQLEAEQAGTFSLVFGSGDQLEGCVHAFGTEFGLSVEQEPGSGP